MIAVGNQNVLFYHEQAFLNTGSFIEEVSQKLGHPELHFISVPSNEVSVEDAVNSYLFNTQIVTLPDGNMAIIAPKHCGNNQNVKSYLDRLITKNGRN